MSGVSRDRAANSCRLLMEAEWEYAARTGTAIIFNREAVTLMLPSIFVVPPALRQIRRTRVTESGFPLRLSHSSRIK